MNPLSIFKYYLNNRKKFLSVFTSIALSTFLLYVVQMLINSAFLTTYNAFVEPQKYYSSITSKGTLIDQKLLEQVKRLDGVKEVIPWVFRYTNFYTNIGGNTGTKVFTVKHDDMLRLMSELKLTVREGRLPEPGTREIAIHYLLAQNKKLKIGDKIGSNLNKEEMILGERTIVGLIGGKSIVSFDSLETWAKENQVDFEYMIGMIIFPEKGFEKQLDKQLEALYLPGLDVRTVNTVNAQNARDTENIKIILTFISILVIVIVSFCTGFLCYIYFTQRRGEFGLLNAIGYSKQQVVNRAFGEISGINAIGFAAGILLSLIAGIVMDLVSYAPRGQLLEIWDPLNVVRAACIPVFVTLFSIIPVWRMLKKLDPISIIEGGRLS